MIAFTTVPLLNTESYECTLNVQVQSKLAVARSRAPLRITDRECTTIGVRI